LIVNVEGFRTIKILNRTRMKVNLTPLDIPINPVPATGDSIYCSVKALNNDMCPCGIIIITYDNDKVIDTKFIVLNASSSQNITGTWEPETAGEHVIRVDAVYQNKVISSVNKSVTVKAAKKESGKGNDIATINTENLPSAIGGSIIGIILVAGIGYFISLTRGRSGAVHKIEKLQPPPKKGE